MAMTPRLRLAVWLVALLALGTSVVAEQGPPPETASGVPIARPGVVTTTEGQVIEGTLEGKDPDGDFLRFSIVSAPWLGTVSLDEATGTFRYQPLAGASGYDTFTFQVEDAVGATSTAAEGVIIVSGGPQWPGQTVRASVASDGGQGNRASGEPSVSADGRYVAFASLASSLVAGDTNGTWDVFVHDRQTGQTSRVSVGLQGAPANDGSGQPAISADGRYVAFASLASNLVTGDTNGTSDIFVHDRTSGQTERVSVANDGIEAEAGTFSEAPAISADGRYVAFTSTAATLVAGDGNGVDDVFVHDRVTRTTWRVSVGPGGNEGDGWSYGPALSADGRLVVFTSVASNLVAGDTNGVDDVFVHDRQSGDTRRVSVGPGAEADGWSYHPALSADGRFVSFVSQATNLVAGDGNGLADVFVHDRQTGQMSRVSVATGGGEANGWSDQPAVSADGRYIAFFSAASNLTVAPMSGIGAIFVYDRRSGETQLVSVSSAGTGTDTWSDQPALSADGRFVAFRSEAGTLVTGDTNGWADIFVVGGVSVWPRTQHFPGAGGSSVVDVSFVYEGSPWDVASLDPWIAILDQSATTGNGAVSFRVAVNDGAARTGTIVVAAQPVTITQAERTAPMAHDGTFTTNEDVSVAGQLAATDPNGDPLAFGIVANGVLGTATVTDAATGAFVYVPAPDASGTDSFTFAANDGTSQSNVATVTVTITGINDAPAALDDALQTAEDVTVAGFLGWTDVDGPTSALRVVTNGSLGTATITDATTGAFTYLPNPNVFGTDVFTFIASDGAADSNVGTVAVTITPVNDAPVAVDGALTIDEDSAGTGALAALDVDGPVSTFTIVANGAHGLAAITDAATGTFTYTPQAQVFGTDTFVFAVHDGSVSSNAGTVTVTIAPVNDPPVAQTGLVTTTAGMPIDGALRASDLDTDALTFSIVAAPALGTVSLDALMGTFRYTPAAGANGYDTFTFQVEDAAGATSTGSEGVIIVSAEPQWPGQTVRASVASGGGQGNRASGEPALSADGRYVAFASLASSLVAGDTNGTWDVFVHDRQSGQTSRVSVGLQGVQSNGWSGQPAVSADGRYVAFASLASNLVEGDTNGTWDIFVRDRASGQTERVSVASDGTEAEAGTFSEAPALSADGRYVAFTSTAATLVAGDANGVDDVFVRDRVTGTTWRVSAGPGGTEADGWSYGPALSADGRYVAFTSVASTLIADDTNGIDDVFVHELQTGQTRRVSVGGDGSDADGWSYHPALSADGRFVSFVSQATNLVTDDGNGLADVFVHDRETGATSRVSVATGGGEANGWSDQPALSADGRYIAFFSAASNLTSGMHRGAWDVFVHDRQTGETRRVSVSGAGTPANGSSDQPAVSADGRFVAFRSAGTNLVAGDANGRSDVFVAGGVSVAPASQSFAARGGTGDVSTVFVYPGSTWHAVSHAPWITLTGQSSTQGNGRVDYSVAPNAGGVRTGTLTVAAQTITITQAENHAPQAEAGRLQTPEDVPVTGQLAASDADGDALTFSIVTNGTSGTATMTDASTGAFTYTPNLHAVGTDTFTFRASDGMADSAVATVTVDIARRPVNRNPVANLDSATTSENSAVTIDVLANDTDADGDTLTLASVTEPANGTAVMQGMSVRFTPVAGFSGTTSFSYTVSDGNGGTATAVVSVDVTPSALPELWIDDVSVTEGDAGTTTLVFTITQSAPSAFTTTVNYATADSSATNPDDYAAVSGTAQISAGGTSVDISLLVQGDTVGEPHETFFVNLSNAVSATIGDGQGVGEIVNDDAGAPTTFELIDQALADGLIDEETALVYSVFAEFGDPRLPLQYQGRDDQFFEATALMDARTRFSTLSQATQSTLAPILDFLDFPDFFAATGGVQQQAPANAGEIEALVQTSTTELAGFELLAAAAAGGYTTLDLIPGMVRIGWETDSIFAFALEQEANRLKAEFLARIWPKLTTFLGTPAAGTKILIKLHEGSGLSEVEVGTPCSLAKVHLFQFDDWLFVHELTHALLRVNFSAAACDVNETAWMHEATATWAQHLVYPPANRGNEHVHAPSFLSAPERSLDVHDGMKKGGHQYGAYLWFFRLAGQENNPGVVRAIWQAAAGPPRKPSLEAIEAVLQASGFGGFNDQWPKFALDNWNRVEAEGKPYRKYYDWDKLSHQVEQAEFDLSLLGGSWQTIPIGYTLPRLSATYRRFNFRNDNTIRGILFSNLVAGVTPIASVQAIVKIKDQPWRQAEDWSDAQQKYFCRDKNDQDIEEIIIVIANRGFRAADPQIEDLGQFNLYYSALPCSDWTGTTTARNEIVGPGIIEHVYTATATDLRFRLDLTRGVSTPPGPAGVSGEWRAIGGVVNWRHVIKLDAGDGATCSADESGSFSASGNGLFDLFGLKGAGPLQFLGGSTGNQQMQTYTFVCTNSDGFTGILPWDGWWFNTGGPPRDVEPGATTIQGSWTATGPAQTVTSTWSLSKEP